MVKSAKDVMDVLDVSGELSLQVMAGVVNVEGKGAYLKSSSENDNSVQVLAQTYFRTVRIFVHFPVLSHLKRLSLLCCGHL